MTAILRQEHCPAAGGEHNPLHASEGLDTLPLPLPKADPAFLLENERETDSRAPLDLSVTVVKSEVQQPGQVATHRGLAGPHGADEKYIRFAEHRWA